VRIYAVRDVPATDEAEPAGHARDRRREKISWQSRIAAKRYLVIPAIHAGMMRRLLAYEGWLAPFQECAGSLTHVCSRAAQREGLGFIVQTDIDAAFSAK
jgi:hypothetical protein